MMLNPSRAMGLGAPIQRGPAKATTNNNHTIAGMISEYCAETERFS